MIVCVCLRELVHAKYVCKQNTSIKMYVFEIRKDNGTLGSPMIHKPCLIPADSDGREGSVCLLTDSTTTALPHCTYRHFISNRKIRAAVEACGSLALFLGYCFFPKFLYVRPGPVVAAAFSTIHWSHALVSSVLLWWE